MGALKDDTAQSSVVDKATYGYGWRQLRGLRPYKYSYDWKPHYHKHHYGYYEHDYGWTPSRSSARARDRMSEMLP